jgi:hypothetical protein
MLQLAQRLGLDLADAPPVKPAGYGSPRVTENCWPTSSSVWSVFMTMPKRATA